MSRNYYLDLADKKVAIPLAVDLLVHSLSTAEKVETEASEMARVMAASTSELNIPLAVAPMDLRVEKRALAQLLDIDKAAQDTFHLDRPLDTDLASGMLKMIQSNGLSERMSVTCEALRSVSLNPGLVPVGMTIGPFSFLTKVMADVITAVYMIGQDFDPDDDPSVALGLQLLPIATELIRKYAVAQVRAGASAIIVCEPAANSVYISPKSMEDGSDVYSRCVLEPLRTIADSIEEAGGDFILHNCGELTPQMIVALGSLRPAVMSLGSSTIMHKAASLVPNDVVLFGNIPSKFFPSDVTMPADKVREFCGSLRSTMSETGHPFILASECDVLAVDGKTDVIREKVGVIQEFSEF